MIRHVEKTSTPVIILGMHRSGTSCLTGSLQQMGLYLDKVFEWNRANLKGNRENEVVMYLNNSVLEESGGSWRKIPDAVRWDSRHRELRDRVIGLFRKSGKPVWGFKDPRALVTFSFWEEALPDMKNVGTFRHPWAVANSLNRRNSAVSIQEGLALWQKYNERLIELITQRQFPLVSFDVGKEEYYQRLEVVARYLGLEGAVQETDFFEGTMRSEHKDGEKDLIPKEVLVLYQRLQDLYMQQREDNWT